MAAEVESATLERRPAKQSALGDTVSIGTILVAVLPVAIAGLFDLIKEWCARRNSREITIEFKDDQLSIKKTIRISSNSDLDAEKESLAGILKQLKCEPAPTDKLN